MTRDIRHIHLMFYFSSRSLVAGAARRFALGVALGLMLLTLLCATSCDRQTADESAATNTGSTARAIAESSASFSADDTILLLSASSLSEALTQIASNYQTSHGKGVNISAGGSNALAQMIIAGVPGEIFLSANSLWADEVQKNHLSLARVTLLTNELVLIVPNSNPADIHEPSDLLDLKDSSDRIMLAGEQVPAGIYARQALTHLHLYKTLLNQNKFARGQSVRHAMLHVETGQAVAGIVYATDARTSDKVKAVYTFDASSHEPITYALLLLDSPKAPTIGRSFYNYLQSPEALAVFKAYGFGIASPQTAHDQPALHEEQLVAP